MSYSGLIPIGTDCLCTSQPQIKANFQAINSAFAEDHVALANTQFPGMHKVLTFREQTGAPVTSATQIGLYTKAVGGIPELFYSPSSAQTPIQLTYPSISTGLQSTSPDVYFDRQYTFIAGPFVFYAGVIKAAAVGIPVTLLPATTLLYVGLSLYTTLSVGSVIGNQGTNFANACATNIVGNSFNIQFQSNLPPQTVYYLAMGI